MATHTSREQAAIQEQCERWLFRGVPMSDADENLRFSEDGDVLLMRDQHVAFLMKVFDGLPGSYVSLDASRTWLVYWAVQSLCLLGATIPDGIQARIIDFLGRCASPTGGFGGGPQQLAHCAPTYSATLALLSLGTPAAYEALNRSRIYSFFMSMKQPCGGFSMHDDGETDVRGTYTVIAVSRLLNILTPQLTDGVAAYLLSCQTYEGGFGGEPGTEAHGGYAFCAVAALSILGSLHLADVDALKYWLTMRQMRSEGGFQGRTNKLVDGCYSFWQGATFAVVGDYLAAREPPAAAAAAGGAPGWFFDRRKLQDYVLLCCQETRGGLIDKPGKSRDYYHTCYCLSGLSIAQHGPGGVVVEVVDVPSNELKPTSPIFNILIDKVDAAVSHFSVLPCDHETLLGAVDVPTLSG